MQSPVTHWRLTSEFLTYQRILADLDSWLTLIVVMDQSIGNCDGMLRLADKPSQVPQHPSL
jgi:hypothetical protein